MTSRDQQASELTSEHPAEAPLRFLIVDDDRADRLAVRRHLWEAGIAASFDEAGSAAEAIECAGSRRYDCIFQDYYMPGADGVELLRRLRETALGAPPVVIFTGRGDEEVAVELMKAGASDYLPKASLNPERIAACIRYTMERARLQEERRRAEESLRESERRERFLGNVSRVLGAFLDHDAALHALSELIVPEFADFCYFDALTPDGGLAQLAWKHVDSARSEWFERARRARSRAADGARPAAARVIATGRPELVTQVTDAWIEAAVPDPEHARLVREMGIRSLLLVPATAGDGALGVLTFGLSESGRQYTEADLSLGVGVASRAAATLHNAHLYTRLEQAVRSRDEVSSIVSHDLRNPVHTITLASSLLLNSDVPLDESQQRQQLAVIRRCATQMSSLLEDLLDISQAEAGHMKVEAAPWPIESIIDEACESFQLSAAELGLELCSEVAPGLPPVLVDRQRILQVLSNLLANSGKFTPRGGQVVVRAHAGVDQLSVAVSDTGVGISAEHLPNVFDRFWQASRAERGSAGLGLAIARSIVESHGGRITVASTEGHGTEFSFTLPVASPD